MRLPQFLIFGCAGFLSVTLLAQNTRPQNATSVSVDFSVYLWPSSADVIDAKDADKVDNEVAVSVEPAVPDPKVPTNEDGLPLNPVEEAPAPPPPVNPSKKLTPAQEARLIRYAGREGKVGFTLLGGNTSQFFSYKGTSALEFYREKKDAEGRLVKTVVGTYDFAPGAKKQVLVFRSTDLNQTFEIEGIEVTDEALPKGKVVFYNSTAKSFELEVANDKADLESKVTVRASLEALKNYKIPCKLGMRVGEGASAVTKPVFKTNLHFAQPDSRLVYYVYEVKENSNKFDLVPIDPFQWQAK